MISGAGIQRPVAYERFIDRGKTSVFADKRIDDDERVALLSGRLSAAFSRLAGRRMDAQIQKAKDNQDTRKKQRIALWDAGEETWSMFEKISLAARRAPEDSIAWIIPPFSPVGWIEYTTVLKLVDRHLTNEEALKQLGFPKEIPLEQTAFRSAEQRFWYGATVLTLATVFAAATIGTGAPDSETTAQDKARQGTITATKPPSGSWAFLTV